MERVSLARARTERRGERVKCRGLWSVGKNLLPQLSATFLRPCAIVQALFFRIVLGRGDLTLTVLDGVSHQEKWESREQWLGIRQEAGLGPLQPLACVTSSLGLRVEGLAAYLPIVSHDAEAFLPGGFGGAA